MRDPRQFIRRISIHARLFFVLTHPHPHSRSIRLRLLSTFVADRRRRRQRAKSSVKYLPACFDSSSSIVENQRIDHAAARIAFLCDARSSRERSALRKEKGIRERGSRTDGTVRLIAHSFAWASLEAYRHDTSWHVAYPDDVPRG